MASDLIGLWSLFKENRGSLASRSIMRSSYVTFFLLHNKLLWVAIWLGPWTVSLLRILTMWQTSVCWSVIYFCEAVTEGVQSFGSTLCTQTRSSLNLLLVMTKPSFVSLRKMIWYLHCFTISFRFSILESMHSPSFAIEVLYDNHWMFIFSENQIIIFLFFICFLYRKF